MNRATVIGIDVGGTKIAGGVVTFPAADRTQPTIVPTKPQRGGRAVLDDVLALARDLAKQLESAPPDAVGLGICELVNKSGELASANCIAWQGLPVRDELSAIAPTIIEADVRAAAVAESVLGAGRGFRNFLFVTVGTGISCCLMLDGQPYLGAQGLTGTMASSPLSVVCEACGHLNRLTLEEIASGPGLLQRFRAAGGRAKTAEEILTTVDTDPIAKHVVNSAGRALASQVGLLVNTLDPEAVIVGGGLGLSQGAYWDTFLAEIRRHIWSGLNGQLPVLRAETGADAGWVGAALYAARKIVQNQSAIENI